MAKERDGKGTVEWRRGRYYARVSVPGKGRPRYPLFTEDRPVLDEREGDRELALQLAAELAEVLRSEAYAKAAAQLPARTSVREFGELWTSGKLYERYGQVKKMRPKKSADADAMRLRAHIYPYLGHRAVADVTEEEIELAFVQAARAAEKRLGRPWRQSNLLQIYQVTKRLFDLAIKPGRLRKDSPVSTDVRPGKDDDLLFSYLYPSELTALLGCTAVPLNRRVVYAAAVYTGLRKASLFALTWGDIDFAHGTIVSLHSKTGLPVRFAQKDPILTGLESLMVVLKRWHEHCGCPDASAAVLPPMGCRDRREAEILRADLRAAGVTRQALHTNVPGKVKALRFHDLRATFATWAQRGGKGWEWAAQRTGHATADMVGRYTRDARMIEDLNLAPFPDISAAIPELSPELSPVVRLSDYRKS